MPVARFNINNNAGSICKNVTPISESAFSFLGDSLASRVRFWAGFAEGRNWREYGALSGRIALWIRNVMEILSKVDGPVKSSRIPMQVKRH